MFPRSLLTITQFSKNLSQEKQAGPTQVTLFPHAPSPQLFSFFNEFHDYLPNYIPIQYWLTILIWETKITTYVVLLQIRQSYFPFLILILISYCSILSVFRQYYLLFSCLFQTIFIVLWMWFYMTFVIVSRIQFSYTNISNQDHSPLLHKFFIKSQPKSQPKSWTIS